MEMEPELNMTQKGEIPREVGDISRAPHGCIVCTFKKGGNPLKKGAGKDRSRNKGFIKGGINCSGGE